MKPHIQNFFKFLKEKEGRTGWFKTEKNNKYNFINLDGEYISDQWFDWISYFYQGFAQVELNNKYNFIDKEGKIISKQWFDNVWNFNEGFAPVSLNGKKYKIDKEGNLFSNDTKYKINEDINVYHGSDRKFDDFDINKIGSGDGKSLGGWGIYFSDNEDVSKRYFTSSGFVRPHTIKSGK